MVSTERDGVVQSLQHGLQILNLFTAKTPELAVGDMAKALDVHRSSASRLARTLATNGYLERVGNSGRYRLGPRLSVLCEFSPPGSPIERAIVPHLQRLVELTGETGHVARLDGCFALTTGIVDGWHVVRMHGTVGKRNPAHCTATGKALLAGMDDEDLIRMLPDALSACTPKSVHSTAALLRQLAQVRRHGYALDDEELRPRLRCIGAPVFDRTGTVVASLSISGPLDRITDETLKLIGPHVRWAAKRASIMLGCPGPGAGWQGWPTTPPPPLPWPHGEAGGYTSLAPADMRLFPSLMRNG